jgi:N-acetylglucosaminyldiphosphoundecaprenol N-acetyl-beta-D-mannosaminyltransferase
MRQTVAILGIPIDNLDTEQVLERLDEFVLLRRFHQVATANTDFLIKAHHDPELKAILRRADLVVPDGMPLVKASHWLKNGLPERVTGADLVPRLATRAAQKGYSLFMLGAKPEVAAKAKEQLETDNPGIRIVGCVSPPLGHIVTMDNESILQQIEEAKPDILLVAFGNPKQEKWIHMHRYRLDVPVCIGVGGTFDFIAGNISRAPQWMQRSGLEWLYRFSQEPRRLWKRYVEDIFHFTRLFGKQFRVMRSVGKVSKSQIVVARTADSTVVSITGSLGNGNLADFQQEADRALNSKTHLVVDLQQATHLDSATVGTLINLAKRAASVEREVRLIRVGKALARVLDSADTEHLFRTFSSLDAAVCSEPLGGMRVHVDSKLAAATVRIGGRAVVDSVEGLIAKLQDIPTDAARITIAMDDVQYVECGILAVLSKFAQDRKQAGTVVLFQLGGPVLDAVKREKLEALFPATEPSLDTPSKEPAAV